VAPVSRRVAAICGPIGRERPWLERPFLPKLLNLFGRHALGFGGVFEKALDVEKAVRDALQYSGDDEQVDESRNG
jgi:hypothetical protein